MVLACCLPEVALLSLVDKKTETTPWPALLTAQLVPFFVLGAILFRLEAEWYDYVLLGVFVIYEVFVIRGLLRHAARPIDRG